MNKKKSAIKKPVFKKIISKPKLISKIKVKSKNKTKIKPIVKIKTPIVIRPKEIISDSKSITDIQVLENFLGGQNKVKLWKVFLLNTEKDFILKDLIKLTKIKHDSLIFELRDFMKLGLVKGFKKENKIMYRTNKNFPLIGDITEMILNVVPRSTEKVLEKLNKLSRLKIVLLSGFFTSPIADHNKIYKNLNSGIDLLLVFEKIPDNVDVVISEIEHSLGREISYSSLDQVDFKYRHSIGDKLIRDVLDFEHVIAMDKLSFFR